MHKPPHPYELEVSIFGPGRGECVVAHVGEGDWIVVDSCIERASGNPIALDYLRSLQVDIATGVKMVVASHWHDDHIKGLSKLFVVAKSATFVDSAAYASNPRLLSRVVKLGATGGARATTVDEYHSIYEEMQLRRKAGENKDAVGPKRGLANAKLLALGNRAIKAEVVALSPSHGTFNRAENELMEALDLMRKRKQPPTPQGPNKLSMALWLKVGAVDAILGADLENVAGTTEGWTAVINSTERPEGSACIYKVPHHGSKDADCDGCWTELLSTDPVAVVTPYAQSKLPTPEDIRRLCDRTKRAYLTSDYTRYKAVRHDRAVERTLRESKKKLISVEGKMGHVRIRVDARASPSVPSVELFNGALMLLAV